MEAVDPHVEAAVLWLAQTILEVLFAGKMEAWIRLVRLVDETEELKSEIERVEAVVTAVKGMAAENRPLARSLGRLKELLYDADDMVDELDYYRLQHQVEGGTIAWANQPQGTDANGGAQLVDGSRDNPGVSNRNDRKKRSKAWEEFSITEEDAAGKPLKAECIYCHTVVRCETTNGTSVLRNHLKSENCKRKRPAIEQTPIPSSADNGAQNGATVSAHDSDRRKRIRSDDTLAHNAAANTHLWDMADICNRIQQTTHQLQKVISEVQKIYGSGFVASSNPCPNTAADPRRRTSSLVQRNMYGRVAEKNSVIKRMKGDKPDGVIVLPIVGSGGIGKTALAQVVYNDPIVKSQFDHRIWIWVSQNFDEVRLTTEMLDFVSEEKHAGISSLAKLQEILVSHVTSKRCLLILDDVWDDMGDHTWNKLLAPMQSDNETNVILVTTRKLSIANATGTVEPIKLGALRNDDFWLLFRECAFGGDNHQGHPCLDIIGRQIAEKLYGNPLAADTVGMLLRVNLTVDHWSNILKNEKWKSLHLSKGIMYALKLSYDELPYYLQQCFLYCSIFPNDYQFFSNELVSNWISQGFVKYSHSTERLEEIGWNYLTDLLNSGFFEQVEPKGPTLGDQTCYVMPPLVHDFARLVSRTECAAIDGLKCNGIIPSIRHLSVLTDSAYHKDQNGNILRNMRFEEKLQSITTALGRLRTLVLIGKYDSFFFRSFLDAFPKAHYLRVLQISATYADFDSFLHSSVSSTHLRQLKLVKGSGEAFPISISNFYHLQVLDVGHETITNDMSGLVSMRHLVVKKGEPFMNPNFFCFKMTQLESMKELLHLRVHQLQNVNVAEAYGAKLRDKQHLENLHLLWKCTLSQNEYDSYTSSEPYGDTEPEAASWPVNDLNNLLTSEQVTYTEKEVLEGLEPHPNLKHLRISGYSGATFPGWLSSKFSVTCMQTLHLDNCRECQVIPSLEMLRFLTKLMLINMQKVTQVSIPSLEELVLIQMPNLEKCSCNSVRDLNSSLRILKIERCHALEAFPLFESCEKFRIEQKSWLSGLSKLVIHDCPQLIVSNPVPPSSRCKLSISRVSTLPTMEGSSDGELIIGTYYIEQEPSYDEDSDGLTELNDKILAFHNLRALTSLKIAGCDNLMSISLEGLRKLVSLKTLMIHDCKNLFPSTALPEDNYEGMAPANFGALPSLKRLSIHRSGIAGKWLSVILRHAQALEELSLRECWQITGLLVEEEESNLSNPSSAPEASSSRNPDEAVSSRDGLLCFPSNLISSLKKMCFEDFYDLTFQGNKKGFSELTSLEELKIYDCPKMISSCAYNDKNDDHAANGRLLLPQSLVKLDISHSPETLQLCFPGHLTRLKILNLWWSPRLESLQLQHCTALEELSIGDCESLTEVEGPPSLGGIRSLEVRRWPGLIPWLHPRLVRLEITDWSILTTSSCMHLTSLRRLEFHFCREEVTSLTDEQERALQLLTSLQELVFRRCDYLEKLPVGLHSLSSLKRLEINFCWRISRLPEKGLPPWLEELEICGRNEELTERCREVATSKLKVKIAEKYVN